MRQHGQQPPSRPRLVVSGINRGANLGDDLHYSGTVSAAMEGMLLGIPSIFTQAPWAAMNSTLTAGVAALTYLCCDPLLKALYALRCFYGESLGSGQDLRAELRR